jgi:hypothetical protein
MRPDRLPTRLGACLPNRAFGTLHDPLPLPAYRGGFGQIREPSFYVGLPDHSLASRMDVDVSDFHCLLVAALITVEGLDHVILKPKKFDRVVAVNVDEVLRHLLLALSKQS